MDVVVFVCLLVLTLGIITPFVMIHRAKFSSSDILRRRVMALAKDAAGDSVDVAVRARQRAIQGKLRELEKQRSRRRGTLSHLIMQSGLSVTIVGYFALSIASGLFCGLVLYMAKMSVMVCLAGIAGGGLALPRVVLKQIIQTRQKKFTHHFGDALDILVRGARTGLPVGECLRIVGREVPDPVGYEFRMLVESQRVGMTTEQALERGLERMPTADFQFFAVVLVIQQQTGGNLAATLENLSNILRSRRRLKERIQAMSSEAKASAMIIGSLPFIVGGLISMASPNYLHVMFTTSLGHTMITMGLSWMAVGIFVMYQMINFEI